MAGGTINSVGGAVVLVSAAFLLGTLAVHWTADHLVLWQRPLTAEHLAAAHAHYARTFPRDTLPGGGSGDVHAWAQRGTALAGLIGVAGAGVKVFAGGEDNWLFDGATLFLLSAVGGVTIVSVLPILRAIPPLSATPSAPETELPLTQQLQNLASLNVTIAAALVGVLLLQGGQYYALRSQDKENAALLEKRVVEAQRVLAGAEHAGETSTQTAFHPQSGGETKKTSSTTKKRGARK